MNEFDIAGEDGLCVEVCCSQMVLAVSIQDCIVLLYTNNPVGLFCKEITMCLYVEASASVSKPPY